MQYIATFINYATGYRINDGILAQFYLQSDTYFSQVIDSGYTQYGSVILNNLQASQNYIVKFTGVQAPQGTYYATTLANTDSVIVTLNNPAPISSGVTAFVGPPGPQGPAGTNGTDGLAGTPGASGMNGYFVPVEVVSDFTVNVPDVFNSTQQILNLSDKTPFQVGNYILVSNDTLNISGTWQVSKTFGAYLDLNSNSQTLGASSILVEPVDLVNYPAGNGCQTSDVFPGDGTTFVSYGAPFIENVLSNDMDVEFNNLKDNDVLTYVGGYWQNRQNLIYDIHIDIPGLPNAGQVVKRFVFPRQVNITNVFAGTGTNPVSSVNFNVYANNVYKFTFSIMPDGSVTNNIYPSSPIIFNAGDYMKVVAPVVQDKFMADIAITFFGFFTST